KFPSCEPRYGKQDVELLPLPGLSGSIHKRRVLTVDRPGLAVRVDVVGMIAVPHLDFVDAIEKDAAVAPGRVFALGAGGRAPLDVQLDITKVFAGEEVPRLGRDFHVAIFDLPSRRLTFFGSPLGKVRAIEKNDGIRGWPARVVLRAARSWGNDLRMRPLRIVHTPLATRKHRRVLVARREDALRISREST